MEGHKNTADQVKKTIWEELRDAGLPKIARLAFIAVGVYLAGLVIAICVKDVSKVGQFGDAFGALTSIFNALAFAAVVATVVLQSRGDYDGAEGSLREALALARRLPGDHRRSVAENSGNLAWVLRSKGGYEEAEKLSREALDLSRELFGAEHPNVLVGQVNIAAFLQLHHQAPVLHDVDTRARERLRRRVVPDA